MAEFGQGDVIPRVRANASSYEFSRAVQKFSGQVLLSVEECVKHMTSSSNLKTWIIEPSCNEKLVYTSSGYPSASRLSWKRIKPKTLKQLNDMVYTSKCSDKPYLLIDNNCQHFAKEMYEKCD